jgi:hypothetical protein
MIAEKEVPLSQSFHVKATLFLGKGGKVLLLFLMTISFFFFFFGITALSGFFSLSFSLGSKRLLPLLLYRIDTHLLRCSPILLSLLAARFGIWWIGGKVR